SPATAPKAVATIAAAPQHKAPDAPMLTDPLTASPEATPPEATTLTEATPPVEARAARPTRSSPASATRSSSTSTIAIDEPAALATGIPPANAPPSQLAAPPVPATTPSMLAAEVALLDQARGAVAAKSGERALDALGRYARQFPGGTLNLEATVL